MKTCTTCNVSKSLDAYAKNGKNGMHTRCKECARDAEKVRRLADPEAAKAKDRAAYMRNIEAKKARIAANYQKNREMLMQRARDRYAAKSEHMKALATAYRVANRDKVYEWNSTRRAQLRSALPAWADRGAIRAIYEEARRLTRETGIEYHVDHEVPLSHPLVCGLHVPANLCVLPAAENLSKSNRFM